MRFNSKVWGIFTALFILAIVISAANAADLVNDFNNENFSINIPSGSDFSQNVTTDINVSGMAMDMIVFENIGNSSKDVGSITYLKDSTSDKKVVSDFINDLKKDNEIVEENDKYTVVKTQNSGNSDFSASDIKSGIDNVMSFANDILSSQGDINFSSDGNDLSISKKGLEISDANGTSVSISSQGVKVSDSKNSSNNAEVSFDGNITDKFQEGDYILFMENQNKNQLILLNGNNLESLKAMADTASFK